MFQLNLFSTAQVAGTDFLFRVRTGLVAKSTVIVGIDQRTQLALTSTYGPAANWPRTIYARALDALMPAAPRVVAFDIFFDQPKPEDGQLADAIRKAGNVLLPVEAQQPTTTDMAPTFNALNGPTPVVRTSAAGEGITNISTDQDGVVRSLPLIVRAEGEAVPSIAIVAAANFARRPRVVDSPPSPDRVYAAGRVVPAEPGSRMLINFLQAVPVLSLVDVLEGSFDQAQVRDRIVLIGVTLPGVDQYATPASAATPMWGVEVLANAIETLVQERFLTPATPALTVGVVFGMSIFAAVLVALLPPLMAAVGVLAALLAYVVAAAVCVDGGLLLNMVYPPAAGVVSFGVVLGFRVMSEQAEQRMLREAMGLYLSPSVSRWVLDNPDRLRLGGETRVMTVLFSDIRDFTTLSETMDSHMLVALLNEYMTAMTEVIFGHDGVLDKYIGDAVMAFWNAPMAQDAHAQRACSASLEMLSRLRELQRAWSERGIPALEIGIGVNTGPMVVGNMGSRARLAYTVVGDAVNVASRLEGLNKVYGTRVVVAEATREAAGAEFEFRYLDAVAVKGRSEPVAVYELVGRASTS